MNTSDEEKQMELLASLKETAIDKYEELRAENLKTKDEYDRLKQERDDAVKKLDEFNKISHMVIEEVGFMQSNLEIEKTCRESAEALATKLNKENKTLKRISMLYMAKLGPDIITKEIDIDDDEPSADADASAAVCTAIGCQQQMKDLREQCLSAQEEKKTLAIELETLRSRLIDVIGEVNKTKQENLKLSKEVRDQRKLLSKCNRVSVLAVEEYEELQINLELEKDLRKTAESVAHQMYIEQNKMKRQSQLLLQSAAPNQQLLNALDENAKLTQKLEEEKIAHQQKVKELEEQLQHATLNKELHSLKQQLELMEEEKKELEAKCRSAEDQVKNLKHSVEELQKRIQKAENPVAPPPPPPPPLPPPPPPNPIWSLMSIIRKKPAPSNTIALKGMTAQVETGEGSTDLKRQAVEEMMDRIKKGIHLRPVGQASRPKAAKPEPSKPTESAVQELKGILETLSTSSSEKKLKTLNTGNSETELERILRRRKVTSEKNSSSPAGDLATAESKSMPVLRSVSSAARAPLTTKVMEAESSLEAGNRRLSGRSSSTDGSTGSSLASPTAVAAAGCDMKDRAGGEHVLPSDIVVEPVSPSKAIPSEERAKLRSNSQEVTGEDEKHSQQAKLADQKGKEADSSNC
ncbi:shootin-1 [Ambystoma mexicanum]|uniref:shootin-1 n=1 Tax=Ambystoma mexicanum TaxID=8296 RepID=UPI0037E84DA6